MTQTARQQRRLPKPVKIALALVLGITAALITFIAIAFTIFWYIPETPANAVLDLRVSAQVKDFDTVHERLCRPLRERYPRDGFNPYRDPPELARWLNDPSNTIGEFILSEQVSGEHATVRTNHASGVWEVTLVEEWSKWRLCGFHYLGYLP